MNDPTKAWEWRYFARIRRFGGRRSRRLGMGAFPKYDIGADRMKNEQERRIFPLESAHSR